jgi:hypothetical protein
LKPTPKEVLTDGIASDLPELISDLFILKLDCKRDLNIFCNQCKSYCFLYIGATKDLKRGMKLHKW